MRQALVENHGVEAGFIYEYSDGTFQFEYHEDYVLDPTTTAISLTLPKQYAPFWSDHLFPFFCGLLAEGTTRAMQCRQLQIDEEDSFGLLLATGADTIGGVSVLKPRWL